MEITGLIIFLVIGAWAGWRTGTFIKDGEIAPLPSIFISVFGAAAGGLLFWFVTKNIGSLISSITIAVLVGLVLLFAMGFFNKTRTQ